MKFDNDVADMVNNCWIGTELSRMLGLENRFFSRFSNPSCRPKSLNKMIMVQSTGGLILVRIPEEVSKMIRSGDYVTTRIAPDDATAYDFIFEVTKETRIGFWR